MSKKLQGNGLWESSRMMLPEHREQLLQHNHDHNHKKIKPVLDEQRLESLSQQMSEAIEQAKPVRITLFNPYEASEIVSGTIQKVDSLSKRIKLVNDEGYLWIKLDDVLHIE